jgi:hypothetical protein
LLDFLAGLTKLAALSRARGALRTYTATFGVKAAPCRSRSSTTA